MNKAEAMKAIEELREIAYDNLHEWPKVQAEALRHLDGLTTFVQEKGE